MKLINIPIEPIENRYSSQWDKWFSEEFGKDKSFSLHTIYGLRTSGKINEGSFLDVVETNMYKTSQILQILEILKEYDDKEQLILFFHDLWFPGLETLAYIREGRKLKNLRICGCLHAGSYDNYDFLHKVGMTPWASYMEKGWFNGIADKIFVATHFHKDLLCKDRVWKKDNVVVTGFPIYPDEFVKNTEKEDIILFPHRLDKEKQPTLFDELSKRLIHSKTIKTAEICKTKQEYYDLLNKSKVAVSFALQETWGIAMQEAFFCGCIPIVPDRLSYTEMYNEDCLYSHTDDVASKVSSCLQNYDSIYNKLLPLRKTLQKKGENAILSIIKEIKNYERF